MTKARRGIKQVPSYGDDLRRNPFAERKAALRKVPRTKAGSQYVEHTEGDGGEMFKAVCKLGLEGIVSKKLDAPYRSGTSKSWVKTKNPKAPAAMRIIEGASEIGWSSIRGHFWWPLK